MRRNSCERTREWICVEVDGELSRFELALAERHVHACGECASFRADVWRFTRALRTAPLESPARSVTLPVRRRPLFGASLQAAAAALAVAAVGITSISTSVSQEPPSRRAPQWPLDLAAPTTPAAKDALRFRQLRERTEQLEQIRPTRIDDRSTGRQLA